MDDQLKQRLLGATIVVALAVVFVPMLFDEEGTRRGDVTGSEAPPSPTDARERAVALPAQEDAIPSEDQTGAPAQAPERAGYRIIPLDETPAPAAEPKAAAAMGGDAEKPAAETTVEFGADEGGLPDELPTRDSPLANVPRAAGKSSLSPAGRAENRTHTPATKETRPPPAMKPETAPMEPARGPAEVPTRAAIPAAAERTGNMAKPTGKSVAATKPPEAKAVTVRKAPPPTAAKKSAAATESRPPAQNSPAAEKPVKAAEPAKASTSPVLKPAEGRGNTRSDSGGAAEPPQSLAQIAEPPKPALARPSTSRPNTSTGAAEPAPKKKPDPLAGAASSAAPVAKPAAAQAPNSPPRPAASTSKPKASAAPSRWVVRAGTFTSEASARQLADKLRKKNFTAYVHKASGENGPVYRVQIGSESDRSSAEQTRKRLEASAGISGTLVSHR